MSGAGTTRRIIYMGDVDPGNSSKGSGGTDDNHNNNKNGNINSDGAKLMVNLFTWITGGWLDGK